MDKYEEFIAAAPGSIFDDDELLECDCGYCFQCQGADEVDSLLDSIDEDEE